MPASTEIERRNRAVVAFTILTGARDGAIASFKLGHIDIAEGKIDQDAREVRTKFSKSFVTTRADHRQGQPRDARGDDRYDALPRELFYEQISKIGLD
jgi:hypothetical protein